MVFAPVSRAMALDRWVRFVAAAALPLLGVAAWALRTDPPTVPPPLASVPAPANTAEGPAASEVALTGEKALARSSEAPKSQPQHQAASLPPAEVARPPMPPGSTSTRAGRGACGGLEARVISVGDDPEWTFASIASAPGEPARLQRVGDSVGGWRVAAIEWDRVWVQSGGPRCALELHTGLGTAPGPRRGRDAESDRPPPWLVPEAIADAIEKRSETEYRLDRAALPEIFEQGGNLLSGLRLSPANAAERESAIELQHVPMDSLLERLGVHSGDVLFSLNGVRCATPGAALEALARARGSERLVARLNREGESFEIEIRVESRRL
jgi:general secretion pathway protein C